MTPSSAISTAGPTAAPPALQTAAIAQSVPMTRAFAGALAMTRANLAVLHAPPAMTAPPPALGAAGQLAVHRSPAALALPLETLPQETFEDGPPEWGREPENAAAAPPATLVPIVPPAPPAGLGRAPTAAAPATAADAVAVERPTIVPPARGNDAGPPRAPFRATPEGVVAVTWRATASAVSDDAEARPAAPPVASPAVSPPPVVADAIIAPTGRAASPDTPTAPVEAAAISKPAGRPGASTAGSIHPVTDMAPAVSLNVLVNAVGVRTAAGAIGDAARREEPVPAPGEASGPSAAPAPAAAAVTAAPPPRATTLPATAPPPIPAALIDAETAGFALELAALGPLAVDVEATLDAYRVSIAVERPAALTLVAEASPRLERALAADGARLEALNVDLRQGGGDSGGREARARHPADVPAPSGPPLAPGRPAAIVPRSHDRFA